MVERRKIPNDSGEKLSSLETHLARALQPVKPSGEFVRHIHNRIRVAPSPIVVRRMTNIQYLLLLVGSVLSVIVLVITGARALFYLTNRSRKAANL